MTTRRERSGRARARSTLAARRERAVGPRELARRVHALVPGSYRRLAGLAAIGFLGGVLEAGLLVLLARLAVAISEGASRFELLPGGVWRVTVPGALVVAFALLAAKATSGVLIARGTAGMAARALTEVRLRLLRSFVQASYPVQAAERQGNLQELMTTHADRTTAVNLSLAQLVTAGLNVVTLVVIAVVVDLLAAVAIVATGTLLALGLRPLAAAGRRNAARQADAGRRFASAVAEVVGTARELRVFGVGPEALARLEPLHHRQARHYRRSRFLLLLTPHLYQATALLVLLAGIGLVALTTTSGLAAIGAVVLLLLRALSYGQQTQTAYQALNDSVPYLDQVRAQRDRYLAHPARGGPHPVGAVGRLQLDHVSYEYLPGRPVLRDVCARVEPGEAIGIIGPSGSGKSTLLQILLRLREPSGGRLLVNGLDARQLELSGWYACVAFVPQEPHLVEGSISENIAFHRDIPDTVIRDAARMAHIHDDIAALPLGYDEVIGPKDTTLSGGQQQRLTIARALAGGPDLLVLDEPTSALDLRSEARLQDTLRGLRGRLTLVVVAHRLSTIAECDRVMVLADGAVQGFDHPRELAARSSFYEETLRLSLLHPAGGAP